MTTENTETLPPDPVELPKDTPEAIREKMYNGLAKYYGPEKAAKATGYTPPAPGPAGTVGGKAPPITGDSVHKVDERTRVLVPGPGISRDQEIKGFMDMLAVPGADVGMVLAHAAARGLTPADLNFSGDVPKQPEAPLPAVLAAPATAAEYQINSKPTAEAFHKAGVPTSMAKPLADAMSRAIKTYANLDEKAAQLHSVNENSRMTALQYSGELKRLADLAFRALPVEFVERMNAINAFSTAEVWALLAGVGRAVEFRTQRQGQ